MKKIILAALLVLCGACAAQAGTYLDNQYRFQISLPENWSVAKDAKFDKKSLLELSKTDASPDGKTLIAISALPAQSVRADFSFANMSEEEKNGLFADRLAKIKEKLPENSTLDSQVTGSWGTNSFLVVSMACFSEDAEYKAVIAITYAGGRQYCFYLFADALDQAAADDFYAMLGSLRILK
jgi:hypothetical protein